jgi:L-iditol 2-dehydrogenase
VRDFAQAADDLGYMHLTAFDQIVRLGKASRPDWRYVHDADDLVYEVFVLSGFLAAATRRSSWSRASLRTVVHGFDRLGRIEDRETVVVQGAGPLGLFSVAMALRAGAQQVIVLGAPVQRLAVAKRWGAAHTIDIGEIPDPRGRRRMIREWTDGRGADVVIEASGGPTAFPEGIDIARRGGRYLVIGQVGDYQASIAPRLVVEKQLTLLGVMSGDTEHYYKALQFLEHNRDRFSFADTLSSRYRLEQINEGLEAMKGFREIKPLVVP